MKKATNQDKFKALRLAEIQLTDQEDYKNCVKDMTKTASLNKSEAKVVANAIRSKYLPNVLREAGFEKVDVKPMVKTDSEAETTDFADDDNDDDMEEMHHFEDGEEDTEEDSEEDLDEENDFETAKFEIEVPADMVDAAHKAVQEALDNLLGGEDDMDMDEDMDDDMDSDEDEVDEDMDDDMDMEEDEEEEDSEPKMHTSSIGVNKMTKQALAARRAQREAILKKVASEEEKYPASGTFKYNEDLVNMEGEVDYPSMTMESSEGNSLKEQNPSWAEQKVPTNNADSLQFPDVTKPMKFEGSGDGSLEYTVDWDSLENPSEGLEDVNLFEVPTQMPSMPHKATVPNARVASKELIAVQCTSCGHTTKMTEEAMNNPNTKCAMCDSDEDGKCKECGNEECTCEENKEAVTDITTQPGGQLKMHVSSLDTARIKTAYSCSSKLALAGIIESSDIDSYAEQMLNDELKADAMIRQTKLLLSAAQASTERVAAAAAERMSVRTASSNGISTSPAFTSSSAANSAALDIQSALKGAFTMPTIED